MASREDKRMMEIFRTDPEQAYALFKAACQIADELAQDIAKDAARLAGRAEYNQAQQTFADAIGVALRAPAANYQRLDPGPLLEGATKIRKDREALDGLSVDAKRDIIEKRLRS